MFLEEIKLRVFLNEDSLCLAGQIAHGSKGEFVLESFQSVIPLPLLKGSVLVKSQKIDCTDHFCFYALCLWPVDSLSDRVIFHRKTKSEAFSFSRIMRT